MVNPNPVNLPISQLIITKWNGEIHELPTKKNKMLADSAIQNILSPRTY